MLDYGVIAWWTGGVIAGGAAMLLLWSLVGDRSRGRRRCPRCWYDMSGVAGLMCPECGRTAKRERALFRTRRRRRTSLVASAGVLVGMGLVLAPSVASGAWVNFVPTFLLRSSLPYFQQEAEEAYERRGAINVSTGRDIDGVLVAQAVRVRIQRAIDWCRSPASLREHKEGGVSSYPHFAAVLFDDGEIEARVILPELREALREEPLIVEAAAAHFLLGAEAAPNIRELEEALRRTEKKFWVYHALLRCAPQARVRSATAKAIRSSGNWESRVQGLEALALSCDDVLEIPPEFGYVFRIGDWRECLHVVRVLGVLGRSREAGRIPSDARMSSSLLKLANRKPVQAEGRLSGIRPLLEEATHHADSRVREQAASVLAGLPPEQQ